MRLLLALAAVLLMPAAAAEAAELKVTWPEQRTYATGEKLKVKVVSKQRVRAALVRESASGKVMRTIAARTLRRGTFSAAAPSAGRYSLRLTVAGRRYARDFTITAPAPATPGAPPSRDCVGMDGDRAELRLGAASAQAGDTLPFELVNTSSGCLTAGVGYSFERLQPDGTWAQVPTNYVFPAVAVVLSPGKTYAKQAKVPAGVAPGSYRLVDAVHGANGRIELTAPFEVLAS